MVRFTEEDYKQVQELMRGQPSYQFSGFTSKFKGGVNVQQFEEQLEKYFGVKHAIAVNSGTTALILALGALKLRERVCTTAVPVYTFTACPAATQWWQPQSIRFVDIDPNTLCMDYHVHKDDDVALAVHALGMPCDLDKIPSPVPVLEDCAQAFGTRYKGRRVGGTRDVAILSFQETKMLTTGGEGGAILTNNDDIAEKCALMRNHGEYYANSPSSTIVGGNFRMTEYQAAWGIVQMNRIDRILSEAEEAARYVCTHLPECIQPPPFAMEYCLEGERTWYILACQYMEERANLSRGAFLLEVNQRRDKLRPTGSPSDIPGANNRPENGIISAGYQKLMSQIPAYKDFSNSSDKFPVAEAMLKSSVWLDLHRFRSLEDIKVDLDILHDVANGRKTV